MDYKKALIIIAIATGTGFGCKQNETHNTLTKAEIQLGWELLFDGESFNNLRGLGRDHVQTDHWKVEDDNIRKIDNKEVPLQANGEKIDGGDLMTIETYDNFELSFEWKIKEGGNSGIKYNVSKEMSVQYDSKMLL